MNLKNDEDGTIYDQFVKSGWWDSKEFLPNTLYEKDGNLTYFSGIVANFRKLNRYGKSCVLMTIGVGNGKYLDLVINKKYPFGYYGCIEGRGIEKEQFNSTFIEVEDFRAFNLVGSSEKKFEKFFI